MQQSESGISKQTSTFDTLGQTLGRPVSSGLLAIPAALTRLELPGISQIFFFVAAAPSPCHFFMDFFEIMDFRL